MSESQQIQLWGGSYANSGLIDPNHWLGGYPPNSFPHYCSNSYPSTHKLGGLLILGWLKYYPITVTSHAITVISCYQILWYGLRLSLIRSYKCPGPPPQWLHLVCALRSQPQVLFPQLLHALQHLAVARQGHFQPKNGWIFKLGILQVCGSLRTCTLRRRFHFWWGGSRPPHSWLSHLRHGTASNMHKLGAKRILKHHYLVGGWALPLWKMMEFVSWNDDIPNIWKNKSHVPNHQPVIYLYFEATVINHKYSMLPNLASSLRPWKLLRPMATRHNRRHAVLQEHWSV